MNKLLKIMYATTAALEQATIVWETMTQAEKLAMQAPQPVIRQIGFTANKTNGVRALQKSSPSTLDPGRTVPTL